VIPDPAAVDRVAALVPVRGRPVIAVDGVDGAGKTTFADALAVLLCERSGGGTSTMTRCGAS
jgi:putative protein kinase ArgK-like GTPase of G3E family